MECKHCFKPENKAKVNREEVLQTFRNLCSVTTTINLVGGEIFLDIPLLKELVKIGVQNRVAITLVTNGKRMLDKLDDQDVVFILKHIKVLGISVDSFSLNTNKKIGRVKQGKSLDFLDLLKFRRMLKSFRTKLKINTVVTKHNQNEDMSTKLTALNPNTWKVIQVSSDDESVLVSKEEFNQFLEIHKEVANLHPEDNKNISKSYLMFKANGDLYYDNQVLDFNINTFKEEFRSRKMFYKKLEEVGVSFDHYINRYKLTNAIKFSKKSYLRKFGGYLVKGNSHLLDVESISPRYSDSREYMKYTQTQLHILYCGVIINQDFHRIGEIHDYINPEGNLSKAIDKSKANTLVYKNFYKKFLRNLKKYKIRRIIVSSLETETRFLQDLIYYIEDLSRKDYEYIQNLMSHMLDIQLVKNQNIIDINIKSCASRNILEELRAQRKDLFTYTREEDKTHDSSRNISLKLGEVYFKDNVDYKDKLELNEIKEYCFDDVYDDLELLYCYEMLSKSSVENVKKHNGRDK